MLRTVSVVSFLVVVLAGAAGRAVTVSISTCGQTVRTGETGVLTTDIVCPPWGVCYPACATPPCSPLVPSVPCRSDAECPTPGSDVCDFDVPGSLTVGVNVEPGARLEMNGHSVSGAAFGVSDYNGVFTTHTRVHINGPGEVFGTREAIRVLYGNPRVVGVVVRDSVFGILGESVRSLDVQATNNHVGVSVFRRLSAQRLTATGNREFGIVSYRSTRLADSVVTGNDPTGAGVDLATELRPRLRGSRCGLSAELVETGVPGIYAPGPPWGVCAND